MGQIVSMLRLGPDCDHSVASPDEETPAGTDDGEIRRIPLRHPVSPFFRGISSFLLDFSACGVYIIQFICFSYLFRNEERPETIRERRLHDGE